MPEKELVEAQEVITDKQSLLKKLGTLNSEEINDFFKNNRSTIAPILKENQVFKDIYLSFDKEKRESFQTHLSTLSFEKNDNVYASLISVIVSFYDDLDLKKEGYLDKIIENIFSLDNEKTIEFFRN